MTETELRDRLAAIPRDLQTAKTDLQGTHDRLRDARELCGKLEADHAALIRQRQDLMAGNEATKEVDKQIATNRKELQDSIDLIEGLTRREAALTAKLGELTNEEKQVKAEIAECEFQTLYAKYRQQAQSLAATCKVLNEIDGRCGWRHRGAFGGKIVELSERGELVVLYETRVG